MALLYILHIKCVTSREPEDESGKVGISSDLNLRRSLRRLGTWVHCAYDRQGEVAASGISSMVLGYGEALPNSFHIQQISG